MFVIGNAIYTRKPDKFFPCVDKSAGIYKGIDNPDCDNLFGLDFPDFRFYTDECRGFNGFFHTQVMREIPVLETKATVVRVWTTVTIGSEMLGYRHRHTATLSDFYRCFIHTFCQRFNVGKKTFILAINCSFVMLFPFSSFNASGNSA